jgi:DNA (cytosine-5)-methyltransferase 1
LIDQSALKKNPRKLTPRECARLQGFPESFITNAVSDGQAYKQFGNSVCVPVIRALANQIVAAINAATLVKDIGGGNLKKKKTRKQIDLFVEE